MSQRRHVDANLVGASSVDFYFDQSELAEDGIDAADDIVVRDGFATAGSARGHADAAHRIAADRRRNGSAIFLRPAMDESEVRLLDLALGELGGQLAVGVVTLRDHDEAAGFFVEAV